MFCALLIPDFRLQAALRHRSPLWREPVAVVDSDTSVLVELTPAAAASGVCAGMSPPQGLARCLELQILQRVPLSERALSGILLEQACAASALVEQTAENLCTFDLKGTPLAAQADLPGWSSALLRQFEPLEMSVRAGIAANPDLARLATRSTTIQEPVRIVSDSHAFLTTLPLEALEPTIAALAVLHGWGITTLGGLTRLARTEIAARLGPDGVQLWDHAQGRSTRLLRLVRAPEHFEEAFDFEHELDTAQPLLFLLRRFVDQLTFRLESQGLVAAEMRLHLPLSNGEPYERQFRIPSPTADPDVLFRVFETHFDNLRLKSAPTGVRLALQAAKPEPRQFRLFENAVRDPNRFAETLANILAVVGSGNAGSPERIPTHKPDQFTLHVPDFAASFPANRHQRLSETGLPLRRYRPPLPARVHLENAHPRYIVSEQAHGEVADCLGPYRLSGEWWENGWSTEEWDVQMSDGALYRISRQGGNEPTWLVEGCYDK